MTDKYQKYESKKRNSTSKKRHSSKKKSRANADDYLRFDSDDVDLRSKNSAYYFNPFPSEVENKYKEARILRDHISYMICVHFVFIIMEILVYNTIITLMVSELLYMWLIYYGYMTLSKVALYTYIGLMFLAPITGILFILDVGLGLNAALFLCQLAFYGYGGGYYTFYLFRMFSNAEARHI